jgi:hypothetical protein
VDMTLLQKEPYGRGRSDTVRSRVRTSGMSTVLIPFFIIFEDPKVDMECDCIDVERVPVHALYSFLSRRQWQCRLTRYLEVASVVGEGVANNR